ncbi:MAG TPA: hypothetical protein VHB77_02535 [Planctomycetaceae bacterium]|nr:hypothetical protein [Planctomycetaceae bacterium]
MKYVVDIPEEVEQALEDRAAASGSDVAHLIQMAVVSFVQSDVSVGRLPDPPSDDVGMVAPCDLPRNPPRIVQIQVQSKRELDRLVDEE